jgi:hypothetical protein
MLWLLRACPDGSQYQGVDDFVAACFARQASIELEG